jgi:hypothetical protein
MFEITMFEIAKFEFTVFERNKFTILYKFTFEKKHRRSGSLSI